MFERYTVVFTTCESDEPAVSKTALRLFKTCRVWALILSSASAPSFESGICPEQKTKPFAFTACEYGPIAEGAFWVVMISLCAIYQLFCFFINRHKTM